MMFIIIFLFLSSLIHCSDGNLLFINVYDIEELKLKERIISFNFDNKTAEKFIEKYSYSVFSYCLLNNTNYFEKNNNYRELILYKYKINNKRYKPKIYNKFLLLENLKKVFYSNLDKNIALKIAEIYSQYKNYEDAETFSIFSQPYNINIKYIYENDSLRNRLSFVNKEIEYISSKISNKRELIKEANNSFQNKKFDIAKAYYKKLLIDPKILDKEEYKNILLKLGEINFFQNNYRDSLEYLKKSEKILTIQEKTVCLYYIALCYYKTKEYRKALNYFENIKKFYPFTIWETKASIYIEKVKSEI